MGNGPNSPIAVAFVEIRPEPGSFKEATDAEVQQALGVDPIQVPGQFQLEGVDDARRQIDQALGDLQAVAPVTYEPDTRRADEALRELRRQEVAIPVEPDLTGFRAELDREVRIATAGQPVVIPGQLQITGTTGAPPAAAAVPTGAVEAAAAADAHGAHAGEIGHVAEEAEHAHGALEGLASATEHAGHAAEEAAGAHGGHGSGIEGVSAGAGEAVGQAGALFVANERLAQGTARLTLEDEKLGIANHHLAIETKLAGEAAQILDDTTSNMALATRHASQENTRLVASEKVAQRALARTEQEEKQLIRTRVRRAVPIGPFRLAGVGTGVAAGVVAISQATAALAEGLTVTGDAADTFSGRMSNVAANLLNFNVVGAFQALRTEHDELNIAQLRLIGTTPHLTDEIRRLAGATDFAASQQAALTQLTTTPPFLGAALAREQEEGDVEGQARVLQRVLDSQVRAGEIVRQIPLEQDQLNTALQAITTARTQTRQQLEELLEPELPRAEELEHAQEEGDLEEVVEILRLRAQDQREAIADAGEAAGDQEDVAGQLADVAARIKQARARLKAATEGVQEAAASGPQGGRFRVLQGASTEVLEEVASNALEELADLQDERIKLLQQIDKLGQEAGHLEDLEHALEETDHAIEEALDAIAEERDRHSQELAAKAVLPLEEELILAQIANDVSGEVNALQKLRDFYQRKADAKGISLDLRNDYLSRVEAINNQIEGIESSIAAEEERHAQAAKDDRDRAHEALLRGIQSDEQEILNDLVRAESTARLTDDRKFQRELVAFYREQSRNRKLSVEERQRFRDQLVQATADLVRLNQEIAQAERDAMRSEIDAREDLLRDNVTLAELNERGTRDDAAALRKLIAFYRKMAKNRELSRSERRDFLIKQREAERDLRDLAKEETEKADGLARQQFEFLQTMQGFSTNLLGNLIPGFATEGLVGNIEVDVKQTAAAIKAAAPIIAPTTLKGLEGFGGAAGTAALRSPFGQQRAAAAVGPRPFTSGQGETTNDLLRKMLAEMRRANRRDDHPEAERQRRHASASFDYGGGGNTMGM